MWVYAFFRLRVHCTTVHTLCVVCGVCHAGTSYYDLLGLEPGCSDDDIKAVRITPHHTTRGLLPGQGAPPRRQWACVAVEGRGGGRAAPAPAPPPCMATSSTCTCSTAQAHRAMHSPLSRRAVRVPQAYRRKAKELHPDVNKEVMEGAREGDRPMCVAVGRGGVSA